MYKRYKVLHEIRMHLTHGCLLSVAIRKSGVRSKTTIKNWREKSARIDRFMRACMYHSDEQRTDVVENAFFKKLASGSGSPTDYIFYLTNRRPERWKHQNAVINNVIQNSVKNENNPAKTISDEELNGVLRHFAAK